MKIRNGFVSNSSSSSFIISKEEFDKISCKNCKKLLKLILKKQKGKNFIDEHWTTDWFDNSPFIEYENKIVYAAHLEYIDPRSKVLEKVLKNLKIKYLKEDE